MRDCGKKTTLEELTKNNPDNIRILPLDVQKEETIDECIETILKDEGRIDVLINNAGAGFIRSAEQASMKAIAPLLNLTFSGTIRCIKAVLPFMRKQKKGHIINISSVGGLVGQPMNEIYCAAKFAVEGLTESMATYLTPYFNIKTSIIEPGGIITEFGNNIMNYMSISCE